MGILYECALYSAVICLSIPYTIRFAFKIAMDKQLVILVCTEYFLLLFLRMQVIYINDPFLCVQIVKVLLQQFKTAEYAVYCGPTMSYVPSYDIFPRHRVRKEGHGSSHRDDVYSISSRVV